MEDRVLHSADIAALALATSGPSAFANQSVQSTSVEAAARRSEIVFVDASVPDAGTLLADLQAQRSAGRPIEIVTIGIGQDGVSLIGATLAGRTDISAVHVLTHGDDGALQLGSVRLDEKTLMQRAGEISAWGGALTSDADLLIYGCDVAQTESGRQFVRDIASLTGADVAASTDLTGAAAQGANWTLEYQAGHIEAAIVASPWAQANWNGVLNTYTVTTTADSVGPSPTPGTLRWAISQANAHAGLDNIAFAVDGTFSIANGVSGDENNSTGDFDITDSVSIIGNGTGKTIINGNGADRVFDLRSGAISMSGLTIQGGASNLGGGLRIDKSVTATLTNVIVQNNDDSNGASKGAGIYNDGQLTLGNVIVQGNGDGSGDVNGAGIYNDTGAVLVAHNVEIDNNESDKDGGGLFINSGSTVSLDSVTFAGNQAKRGGGIFNHSTNTSLANVTLSGNSASQQGGGLWADAKVTLDHVTVANNSSSSGGGVYDKSADVWTKNSLFAANSGGNSNAWLVSQGYNLSDDLSALSLLGLTDRINTPAGLSALANNGGFTRTHAISTGSAARDAANASTSLTSDQRGLAYYGSRADIGAYEYNPFGFAPTITAIADQEIAEDSPTAPLTFVVGDVESSAASLVVTATSSNAGLVPLANIVLGGSGANRTVSITPLPNANSAANGGTTTLTLSVSDGANTTSTTFVLTVLAVNDAPTVSMPAPQTVNEDTTLILNGANAPRVDDVDAGSAPVQVTLNVAHGVLTLGQTTGLSFVSGSGSNDASMSFIGNQAAVNAALAGLQYRALANYSGSDQLSLGISDLGNTGGAAQTATGNLAITVAAVNDAPVLNLPGAQVTGQVTDLIFSVANGNAISVSDVDAASSAIQLTLSTGSPTVGTLFLGSTAGLTFSAGSGSGDATMTFTGTLTAINAALDGLTFRPDAAFSGSAPLQIAADDLGGTGSGGAKVANAIVDLTVSPDMAPIVSMPRTSFTFTENQAAAALDPLLTIVDGDNATLASATVRIGGGYAGPEDELRFANDGSTMGNITGTYSAGLLSLQSAGATATLAEWQAALRAVEYINLSDQPDTTARVVTLAVNDATADSATRSTVITVVAVNDAPTLSGANDLAQIDEDAVSNNGTAVSVLIAAQMSDLDGAPSVGIAVTGVNNANGSWQYTTDGGATWLLFGSVSDASARLLDADADTSVRFVPNADWNGTVSGGLTFRAWDQSSGTAGGNADASVNGGSSAFSATVATSSVTVRAVNDAPVAAQTVSDQAATQDAAFTFTLPAGLFTDMDTGDTLSFSATLVSGAALPSWLSFDAATQTFSGTPTNADVGTIALRVTAIDSASAPVSLDFVLRVANINDAPVLAQGIAAQAATQGTPFDFEVPAGTFGDADVGDTLSFSATLASGAALPSWLSFDAATQTFSGTPGNSDVGTITLRVTATDSASASTSGDFVLSVANINDAPVLAQPIVDQATNQRSPYAFAVPAGTFIDVDAGDTLSFSATLVSGAALPSWLSFDATTQTFTGTPTNADVGAITLRVTATDASNASISDDFVLNVVSVNSAPVLAHPIVDQATIRDTAFTFVIPAATFTDADPGDTLHYGIAMDSGAPVPSWLSFDAQTRSLTGTPSSADVGQIVLRVTASDGAGASAQGLFAITVSAPPLSPPTPPATPPAPPAEDPVIAPPPAQAPIRAIASIPEPTVDATPAPAATTPSTAQETIPTRASVPSELQVAPIPFTPGRAASWLDALANDANAPTAAESARRESIDPRAFTTRPSSRAEALLVNAVVPQFSELSVAPMSQLLHSDGLMHKLEEMQRHMLEQSEDRRTVIASTIAMSGGLSIGYVVWLVRGGVLVSSMLSALPAWQMIDPLPVLAAARSGADKKDKRDKSGSDGSSAGTEVESLFDKKSERRPFGWPFQKRAVAAPVHQFDQQDLPS